MKNEQYFFWMLRKAWMVHLNPIAFDNRFENRKFRFTILDKNRDIFFLVILSLDAGKW